MTQAGRETALHLMMGFEMSSNKTVRIFNDRPALFPMINGVAFTAADGGGSLSAEISDQAVVDSFLATPGFSLFEAAVSTGSSNEGGADGSTADAKKDEAPKQEERPKRGRAASKPAEEAPAADAGAANAGAAGGEGGGEKPAEGASGAEIF